MADSLVGGAEEGAWPQSDPSFTEETVEQGVQALVPFPQPCHITADMEASEGEEEAWLVAMEKGQLDERGYIPRRPGATLTARQVSLHYSQP